MELPVNYNNLSFSERRKVREEYITLQSGLCYYCRAPLNEPAIETKPINVSLFPAGMFMHPVHLHHDHKTGRTIGAVHSYCNAYLWQYCGE